MRRHLVLFAREPAREARAKGFVGSEAADLFAQFARSWYAAAKAVGARLVVATPPEDRMAWGRRLPADCLWVLQRGARFGRRLENAARDAQRLGGRAILVGGDVAPCLAALSEAFSALDRGCDATLAPAPDGGVSLVGLRPEDLDLLRALAPRRGDLLSRLRRALDERGRSVAIGALAVDVDGRRALRSLLGSLPGPGSVRAAARLALLRREPPRTVPAGAPVLSLDRSPASLRGPPAPL